MLSSLIRNITSGLDKHRCPPTSSTQFDFVPSTVPKDQPIASKTARFTPLGNTKTSLQASQKLVDKEWLTKSLPIYSYRDVAYAVEGVDQVTRTPRRVYITTEKEANHWVLKLKGVIGFDMEWPCKSDSNIIGKTSMVQVSDEHTVLLIHVFRMQRFPVQLKRLIESPTITKTGFWIANDCGKLKVDFGIVSQMCVELRDFAEAVDTRRFCSRGAVMGPDGRQHTLRLDLMVRLYLDKVLTKNDEVRISNWSGDLSEDHLEYAANDAHAGLILFKKLEDLAKERQLDIGWVRMAEEAAKGGRRRETIWEENKANAGESYEIGSETN